MISEIVNGYEITGNHATVGREYRIMDADGKVLCVVGGKVAAIANAEARETGAIPPPPLPEPEPVPEPATEPKAAAPRPEAKPKPARKQSAPCKKAT